MILLPEEGAISPLAAELERLVGVSKGKRVFVEELFHRAGRFDPGLVGDPEARSRFRNALDELQAAGKIILPAPKSRVGWDTRVLPPIPTWVMRVDPILPAPRVGPAPKVWPSALEAAGRIASRADEYELLQRIAAWMRDDPAPSLRPPECPVRNVEVLHSVVDLPPGGSFPLWNPAKDFSSWSTHG